MTIEERIRGRKIGILGMARSGLAVARLTQRMGGVPFVSDSGDQARLTAPCDELRSYDIPFETGGHTERLLASDYLVVSPGVPLTIDIVKQARDKGLPIFSELEVAAWVCPGRIVAITGSNGKTTTTTLIGELLTAAGFDAHVCGNIGQPLADVVERMNGDSIAVVEVSSFQLETISVFKPDVAVILNLTPDHIDRHGSFEAYKKAKYRITENQVEPDVFILNQEDPESVADNPTSQARRTCFTTQPKEECEAFVADDAVWVNAEAGPARVIAVGDIGIKGPHNLQNVAAAVAVANQFGATAEVMERVLTSFPGVEHRLEKAGTVAGVAFVNDSKATNVDSVRMALRSIETPLYLILGGRDKAGVFEPLIDEGREKVLGIICIGEAREKIFDALGKAFPTQFAESLPAAVELGFELAHPGETVLLSPGCASFDMFDNFEHRGRVFKETVQVLKNGKNSDETVSR
jgi:UDP-N-acetylmuramoylalanine--D-glutamate ligase